MKASIPSMMTVTAASETKALTEMIATRIRAAVTGR